MMALSDECFDFLHAVSEAAATLAQVAHHYSAPDYPIDYGVQVDAIKRAAAIVVENPYDDVAVKRLVELAAMIGMTLDTAPNDPILAAREAEVRRLVRIFQLELTGDEKESVEQIVKNAIDPSPYNNAAAGRLKAMLSKLRKPTYGIATKIISDVASAAVKKILGL